MLEAFLHGRRELVELVDVAAGVDLRRGGLSSPVSRLIRLNLADCFAIIIVHEQGHLGQLERIRAHPAFPVAERP